MAKQQDDGSWKADHATAGWSQSYSSKSEAESAEWRHTQSLNRSSSSSSTPSVSAPTWSGPGHFGFLSLIGSFLVASPIIAIICIFLLTLIAGLRGAFIIGTTLPLFGVAFVIGVAVAFTVRRKLGVGVLIGFIVANAVMVPLMIGAYHIYANSDLFFPSMYFTDYIQELPDGNAPELYEKRFQKGDVLARLDVGESVTVNGVTLDYKEFNITTGDGVTGWVDAETFSEKAREMLAVTIGTDGFESSEIQMDGRVVKLLEKYMLVETGGEDSFWVDDRYTDYSTDPEVFARMEKPNISVPLLFTDAKEVVDGGSLADTGHKVTIAGILYEEDCTIIQLACTRKVDAMYSASLDGARGNSNEWKNAFTATDLDTGEKWSVMPFDYYLTDEYSTAGDIGGIFAPDPDATATSTVTFFFPPFKSRHFSLTHEGVLPHPDPNKGEEVKTGYGGLLGLISNWTSGGGLKPDVDIKFNDYNFPEVWVN